MASSVRLDAIEVGLYHQSASGPPRTDLVLNLRDRRFYHVDRPRRAVARDDGEGDGDSECAGDKAGSGGFHGQLPECGVLGRTKCRSGSPRRVEPDGEPLPLYRGSNQMSSRTVTSVVYSFWFTVRVTRYTPGWASGP